MLKFVIIEERELGTRQGQKSDRSEEKTRPSIIYIAGPITGRPDYLERFCKAQLYLESKGWIVLNPADLPAGMPEDRYMPICLAMLDQADAIYMLRDWESSKGAGVEYLLAQYQGKRILYEEA